MQRNAQEADESGFEIRLLGPMEVVISGSPIPRLRTRKVQWLLALLCLRSRSELSREWIAGTLWPDSDAPQASANLRLALCDLRRALGIEAHRLQSPSTRTLRLDLTNTALDLVRFEAAITRGDRESLEEAVALYRGRLLEGCLEPWADLDRERYALAYVAVLDQVAEAAMQRGDVALAETHLRLALKHDPYRESLSQNLMRTLALRGDVAAAIQVYRELRLLLWNDLHTEPSAETIAVYQNLKEKRPETASRHIEVAPRAERRESAVRPRRLPRPLTAFVGRTAEIARLASLVHQNRLVTLTGPGGIGKTRLALEIAQAVAADFPDGVCFVDLARIDDAMLAPSVIATALGLQIEEPENLEEAAADRLAAQSTLVILDNCEHLVAASAEAVESLLAGTSHLHVLATSRQPLGIAGETQWRVQTLSVAPEDAPTDQIVGCEAVTLFLQRARCVRPDFTLSEANAPTVARICRRLDGIPLALELAAARLKILSLEQIAERLDDYFGLLSAGSQTALPRHRTLEAALDWSYTLLSEPERLLLQRLSIFPGRFDLDAAYAVCGGPELESSVLDLIGQLVDKSLLSVEEEQGEALYLLLESTRVYARTRPGGDALLAALRSRHADYFLSYAERARPMLSSAQAAEWLDRLERQNDDFRAALAWYADADAPERREAGLRLANALWLFWYTRHDMGDTNLRAHNNTWSQAAVWLENLLAGDPPVSATTAAAQMFLATLFIRRGNIDRARELFGRSLASSERIGDLVGAASTLHALSALQTDCGEYAEARESLERSLELSRKAEDLTAIGLSLSALGKLLFHVGDIGSACAMFDAALAIQRELGNPLTLSAALTNVGATALVAGDWRAARIAHEESLAINRELKHTLGIGWSLDNLAEVALAAGEIDRAQELYRSSAEVFHSLSHRTGLADCLVGAAEISLIRRRPEAAAPLLAGARALRHWHSRVARADQQRFDRLAAQTAAALGIGSIFPADATNHRLLPTEAFTCLIEQLDAI